jgi:hypothetical protein
MRKAWSRRRRSTKICDDILTPLTGADLRKTLNNMGKNKAPGPSGITVEILRNLPDVALDDWLLPLVNHCLLIQTIPESTKHFMVWCIEKKPGTAAIILPTDKLQLRPISLSALGTGAVSFTTGSNLAGPSGSFSLSAGAGGTVSGVAFDSAGSILVDAGLSDAKLGGHVSMLSGASTSSVSGSVTINSANVLFEGNSGNVNIGSGPGAIGSGTLFFGSGNSTADFAGDVTFQPSSGVTSGGVISLNAGTSFSDAGGDVAVSGGEGFKASGDLTLTSVGALTSSGELSLSTGVSFGASGGVKLSTGSALGMNSGHLFVSVGESSSNNGGSVQMSAGDASHGGGVSV